MAQVSQLSTINSKQKENKKMNYKYIYQFTMTANEITFTESVVDWTTNTIVPAL